MRATSRIGIGPVGLALAAMAGSVLGKDKPHFWAAWLGAWSAGPEQDITIARGTDGDLLVEGFATWGASDPARVERGAVNIGEFTVSVPIFWIDEKEHRLDFAVGMDGAVPLDEASEYDCAITLIFAQGVLKVTDNMMCGGHNVTFDGTYRRQTE